MALIGLGFVTLVALIVIHRSPDRVVQLIATALTVVLFGMSWHGVFA